MSRKILSIIMLTMILVSCTQPPPTAPSHAVARVSYDIHIPEPTMAAALRAVYPGGVKVPPTQAQDIYDYRDDYHGPNVLAAGGCGPVVSPTPELDTSTLAVFVGDVVYVWTGRFVLTPPSSLCGGPHGS